jgi:hypothetical protein
MASPEATLAKTTATELATFKKTDEGLRLRLSKVVTEDTRKSVLT